MYYVRGQYAQAAQDQTDDVFFHFKLENATVLANVLKMPWE
jgi:hypothetical protein